MYCSCIVTKMKTLQSHATDFLTLEKKKRFHFPFDHLYALSNSTKRNSLKIPKCLPPCPS